MAEAFDHDLYSYLDPEEEGDGFLSDRWLDKADEEREDNKEEDAEQI